MRGLMDYEELHRSQVVPVRPGRCSIEPFRHTRPRVTTADGLVAETARAQENAVSKRHRDAGVVTRGLGGKMFDCFPDCPYGSCSVAEPVFRVSIRLEVQFAGSFADEAHSPRLGRAEAVFDGEPMGVDSIETIERFAPKKQLQVVEPALCVETRKLPKQIRKRSLDFRERLTERAIHGQLLSRCYPRSSLS
jgi:hypothetical protein